MNTRTRRIDTATLPRQWVVFRLGHLGDVALTTGTLAALGIECHWRFTFVTRGAWADVLKGHPYIDRIITLRDQDLRGNAFFSLCHSLARKHSGQGFLDLHGTLRSRALSALWLGPVLRYPKMNLMRRLFLHTRSRLFCKPLRKYTVPQRYYLAVKNPPPPASCLLPMVCLSEEERFTARKILDGLFKKGTRPVALHPYAAHALKSWPETHWRTLAGLLDDQGISWVAIGRGTPLFPNQTNDVSNKTTLRESCALLSCCRALISGDSGPMHLATGVGTPVVALFGPTTCEWGFYPSGSRDMVLEQKLACRPCSLHGTKNCPKGGECLSGITPERILAALSKIS